MAKQGKTFLELVKAHRSVRLSRTWVSRLPPEVVEQLEAVRKEFQAGKLECTPKDIHEMAKEMFGLTISLDQFRRWLRAV